MLFGYIFPNHLQISCNSMYLLRVRTFSHITQHYYHTRKLNMVLKILSDYTECTYISKMSFYSDLDPTNIWLSHIPCLLKSRTRVSKQFL